MSQISNYDHVKFIIGRYDHYLNIVNSKGSFYIALNTFLLGGMLTGVASVYKLIEHPVWLWVVLASFVSCSLISIIFTIVAINPYLNTGNSSSPDRSLLFFGSATAFEKAAYEQSFLAQGDDAKTSDCIGQSWVLAKGLFPKYQKLRIAGFFLIAQFGLLPVILFFIINNLK